MPLSTSTETSRNATGYSDQRVSARPPLGESPHSTRWRSGMRVLTVPTVVTSARFTSRQSADTYPSYRWRSASALISGAVESVQSLHSDDTLPAAMAVLLRKGSDELTSNGRA